MTGDEAINRVFSKLDQISNDLAEMKGIQSGVSKEVAEQHLVLHGVPGTESGLIMEFQQVKMQHAIQMATCNRANPWWRDLLVASGSSVVGSGALFLLAWLFLMFATHQQQVQEAAKAVAP